MCVIRKINKEATAKNILKEAEGYITDIDLFNELMRNEQAIKDIALLWEVEVIYE